MRHRHPTVTATRANLRARRRPPYGLAPQPASVLFGGGRAHDPLYRLAMALWSRLSHSSPVMARPTQAALIGMAVHPSRGRRAHETFHHHNGTTAAPTAFRSEGRLRGPRQRRGHGVKISWLEACLSGASWRRRALCGAAPHSSRALRVPPRSLARPLTCGPLRPLRASSAGRPKGLPSGARPRQEAGVTGISLGPPTPGRRSRGEGRWLIFGSDHQPLISAIRAGCRRLG
jgi:hypothetical protein